MTFIGLTHVDRVANIGLQAHVCFIDYIIAYLVVPEDANA